MARQHYNRFGRMRMDGRDLLGPDDDAWVRQLLPGALFGGRVSS